jgi:protein-L-isoaspartate(D-aspartate) O-methyltransferase
MSGYNDLRKEMVERQIKARGMRDPLVLDAMCECRANVSCRTA